MMFRPRTFRRVWYVAKSGSAGNDGSPARPLLTVNAAAAAYAPGDAIVIRPGTYHEKVNFPYNVAVFGTPGQSIIEWNLTGMGDAVVAVEADSNDADILFYANGLTIHDTCVADGVAFSPVGGAGGDDGDADADARIVMEDCLLLSDAGYALASSFIGKRGLFARTRFASLGGVSPAFGSCEGDDIRFVDCILEGPQSFQGRGNVQAVNCVMRGTSATLPAFSHIYNLDPGLGQIGTGFAALLRDCTIDATVGGTAVMEGSPDGNTGQLFMDKCIIQSAGQHVVAGNAGSRVWMHGCVYDPAKISSGPGTVTVA